jgi:predicted lipoprotein with Yx(FWY)xxD motif
MPVHILPIRSPAIRTALRRASIVVCAVALAVTVSGLLDSGVASAHGNRSKATVKVVKVKGLGKVLADTQGRTVYTLTDGDGAAVACTGACLSAWPPLELASGATLEAGKRVTKLDTDANGQVTHDGLPLYLFSGDSKAHEANGEGIASFGGTWHVVEVAHRGASHAKKSSSATSGGYGY